ncbi:MAG: Flp pilus assembly protein CpaB, partial [Pseudomonadota bacterium]
VAAGAAIAAALLLRSASSQPAVATVVPSVETVTQTVEVSETDVLVAARDMVVGHTISPEDLSWETWPESALNEGYFVKADDENALTDLAGMMVRTPIFANEPILPQRIVAREGAGILAALVRPGMRAVSLEVSVETASGGFILPEDRVDVILTHSVERSTAEGVTEEIQSSIILENVRVLAIDQGIRPEEGQSTLIGSTATLELSSEDAALVAFGERKGVLSLALRSLADAAAAGDQVVSKADSFAAGRASGQVTVFRNGRIRESNAGGD